MAKKLVWLLPTIIGCGEPTVSTTDLPPLEWTSDRIALGTDLSIDDVCAGTLAVLERDIESIESALELEDEAERVSVWVLGDSFEDHCPAHTRGCAGHGKVVIRGNSFTAYHRHEMVHARLGQIRPVVKPFFEEGLATELGGRAEGCGGLPECASADLGMMLDIDKSFALTPLGYSAAADMIHGMLLDVGPAAVIEFTNAVPRDATADDTRALYAAYFGSSLDNDFELYKRGALDEYTPSSLGCDLLPAPRDTDGGVLLSAAMECGSPNVVNDFAAASDGEPDRGVVEWSFVVDSEHTGGFVLIGVLPEGSTLGLRPCLPDSLWLQWSALGPWFRGTSALTLGSDPVMLGPGLHKIEWHETLGVGAAMDVVLRPVCSFENQNCPAGEQCTIWNLCEPQVAQPAAIGEACSQSNDGPRTCVAGARCLGGLCVAECDATHACPDGQGCARVRVCGPPCQLLAQDCETGFSCLPSGDPLAAQAGMGQCVPAGEAGLLETCDTRESGCEVGLSCEPGEQPVCDVGELDGCCVPLCDPNANDPGCPSDVPNCRAFFDGLAGVCR